MRMSYAEGLASPEIEIAEGGTMLDNKSKFADLKMMLDSNKENVKMDAMKRIINMVARGKDVSELFPAVVKNVACKNLELKKLVYVYLVRYAEEQQDLALLSISTFQRALKDPNQLIRASALRVLSSIRVSMIAPVMLLAIKDSVRDMSAYVRKVAAHAIPKLYSLDPDLQPQLIDCIDFLLGDKRTLVLGSAVYAFEETCPDRFDLLHRHFRSLCRALADIDEWGQVMTLTLLTHYARTQFTAPSEDNPLDPDHSLLIISARPLLQSRNCAVVMAVAQLLYYIAPTAQLSVVPKALIRLLRGPNEVQYVVLVNIATICASKNSQVHEGFAISKNLFEPFLKSFFVRSSDSVHVKQLKLQILTSLVTETNVQLVVRELQAYLQMGDLASLAIEAIGRCALQVPNSANTCLSCLINLISSKKENIVCAAVVVLKKLLHTEAPISLLKRVVKLIHTIQAPPARACVIWLVATHYDKVSNLAPDLLRIMAKNFANEADIVKLQTLNLAVRLWIKDREKCELLTKYIFQLARYDRSYDIRDRCRLLRNFLFKPNNPFPIEIFMRDKPAPTLHSQFSDRESFQLGTLSHLLNQKCMDYCELPDFPDEAPDPTVRRSAMPLGAEEVGKDAMAKQQKELESEFYSEEEGEDEDEEDEEENEEEQEEEDEEDEAGDEEEEDEDEEEDEEDEDEEESSEEEESEEEKITHIEKPKITKVPPQKSASLKTIKPKETPPQKESHKPPPPPPAKNNLDLLLDLDFTDGSSSGVFSKYIRATAQYVADDYFPVVNPIVAGGLTIEGKYTRAPSLFSNSMVSIELLVWFKSNIVKEANISIVDMKSPDIKTSGDIHLNNVKQYEKRTVMVGIDFGDGGRVSEWKILFNDQEIEMKLQAPFGEQVEAIDISAEEFNQQKAQLSGMHRHQKRMPKEEIFNARVLYKIVNCKQVQSLKWSFAAQTVSKKEVVLISFQEIDDEWEITVNCENLAFGSLLCRAIHEGFNK